MDSRRFFSIFLLLVVARIVDGLSLPSNDANEKLRIVSRSSSPWCCRSDQARAQPREAPAFQAGANQAPRRLPPLMMKAAADNSDAPKAKAKAKGIVVTLGILSALAWVATSATALSYHPDPKFADCTVRHNILTMSQAFAFPLPIGFAAVFSSASSEGRLSRPMNLALSLASLWLAGASVLAPKFAFGYDLYKPSHKAAAGAVHLSTAVASLVAYRTDGGKSERPHLRERPGPVFASRLWRICSLGLLWFTVCPIFAPYPLATVPTILGKRLSRPASAFSFLGATLAFCLGRCEREGVKSDDVSVVRKSLLLGSSLHLMLIALKLIGVDGGGLLLRGNGLWEVYPAMLAVPFATASSLALHGTLCFAATREG